MVTAGMSAASTANAISWSRMLSSRSRVRGPGAAPPAATGSSMRPRYARRSPLRDAGPVPPIGGPYLAAGATRDPDRRRPMTAADRAALAERGASLIHQGFEAYHRDFLEITRRAKGRFEQRDWAGAMADARERL